MDLILKSSVEMVGFPGRDCSLLCERYATSSISLIDQHSPSFHLLGVLGGSVCRRYSLEGTSLYDWKTVCVCLMGRVYIWEFVDKRDEIRYCSDNETEKSTNKHRTR